MPSQGLQLAQLRWCWRPGSGLLLFTETTDQSSIRTIILVAQQFALAESFDLGRIDDADCLALFMEIKRQRFAIRTSGLQASMDRAGFMFAQPGTKFSKTFFAVSESAMTQFVID